MSYQKIGHDGKPLCEPGVAALFDPDTGLTWMSKDLSASEMNWKRAMQEGRNSSYAGFDDWRVPTIAELETLRDLNRSEPAANPELGLKPRFYWSSTPLVSSPGVCAWGVSFNSGSVFYYHQLLEAFVRLVRGPRAGQ